MKAVRLVSALLGLVFACQTMSLAAYRAEVELQRDLSYRLNQGYVEILRDKQQIARYVYKDTSVPYIYPLNSLGGLTVTREYTAEGAVENIGRSFWFGYGDVNGIDFWSAGDKSGRIVQTSQEFDSFNAGYWNLHTMCNWVGPDDKVILREERRNSFLSSNHGLLVSTMTMLIAGSEEVKFGDSPNGLLALRVVPGLQLKGGKGHILNSNGEKDADCLGKRAKWCDYTGELNGKPVGITVFDVATNYGFPAYWNVTEDGLLAANPFGGKSLTNVPENESSYTMKPGEIMTFVYIVLVHDSKLDKDTLDDLAMQIAGGGLQPPPNSIDAERLKELTKDDPSAPSDDTSEKSQDQSKPVDAARPK